MTPEQQDSEQQTVRRLLAAAGRTTEPLPGEVGARLDDLLSGLVAERDQPGDAAPVPYADLGARRRRRWAQVLVAAAAVSVVAVGVGNLSTSRSGSESTGGAAVTATEDNADTARGGGAEAAPGDGAAEREAGSSAVEPEAGPTATMTRLRSGSLTRQVQQVENFALAVPVPASAQWSDACVRPQTRPGDAWLPVRLDGRPAVLVLRAPEGGRRTADIYTCGSDGSSPTATTTVRAR